jgi:Ca-activated chloride channel family protein
MTSDQQGRYLYDKGDYEGASERFADPMWKGTAYYRAGDYENAVLQFGQVDTAEGWFNLGNAYAGTGNYEEAVSAYDEAVRRRPGWKEAEENREMILALIPPKPKEDEEEFGDAGNLPPDDIVFDEKGEKGKVGEIEQSELTEDQLAEMWMRRLQTTPADFMRIKFAVQAAREE